ncbi:hypothetical protein WDV06_15045 [Streptomyces racemochromogenes]|uniref:XRE family transcriptional regulator n=1 Tax=Streptomyces racemochromogenes TaxID=67353 RepID=A0ABW7PEL1_9ACTN
MNRPGRLPGPLKGRTAEANALAQFLRDLTSEYTVSRLEERYGLSRSVWSEYRSGQKIIPFARLNQIIEDRFARDPRTRGPKLQEARRLHTAATAAASAPGQFPPRDAGGRPAGAVQASASSDPAVDVSGAVPEPAELRGEPAGLSADRDGRPDADLVPPGDAPAEPPQPGPLLSSPRPAGSAPGPKPPTDRLRRWRTPAQWAALAALASVLVIANQSDRSTGQSDTSPPDVPKPSRPAQSAGPEPLSSRTAETGKNQPKPGTSQDPATPASRAPEYVVTIEKPADGPVPRCIDVSGQGQPAQGHQLWIGMRVDKEFFILRPVSQDSTAGAGRWSAKSVTVGSEEGAGADYAIAVLDVTPDLSTTLTGITVDGQPDSLWRIAFPSYPAGTVIKAERPLHRNASEQAGC